MASKRFFPYSDPDERASPVNTVATSSRLPTVMRASKRRPMRTPSRRTGVTAAVCLTCLRRSQVL